MINKKTLQNLVILSRIEIKNEEKILKDLEEILNYFGELKKVDTQNITPMDGCNFSENIFREDNGRGILANDLTAYFPEKQDGFLFVPPVF